MLDNATSKSNALSREAVTATAAAAVNPRDVTIEVASAGSSTTNDPSGTDKPPATGG